MLTSDYVQFSGTILSGLTSTYITDFEYDEDEPWLMFVPSKGGGSSTTYVTDRVYRYTSSTLAGLSVGNYGGGSTYSGLFFFRGNASTDGNSRASRLVFEG